MTAFHRIAFGALLLGVVFGTRLTAAQTIRSAAVTPAPEPRITAARGATLEGVVRALEAGVKGVLVADVSAVDSRLQDPLKDMPLNDALRRISVDFDRLCLRRGRAVALQRRFGDPDEDPGAELEELRLAAEQMYRLLGPFRPSLKPGRPSIHANMRFVASISGEQQTRMLTKEGMPFTELEGAQQAAWMEITSYQAYGDASRDFRRAMLCMRALNRGTLRETARIGERRSSVAVTVVDPEAGADDGVDIPVPLNNIRPYVARAAGVDLAEKTSTLPSTLRAAWAIPAEKLTLEGLARRLQSETGIRLEIPDYAAKRSFWIYSRGGARGEVLLALADLWGWDLTPAKEGFRLGYPRLGKARDPYELHLLIQRSLPPAVRHQMEAVQAQCTERWAKQLGLVLADADRAGDRSWKTLPVATLEETSKVRLANLIAWRLAHKGWRGYWKEQEPPGWLTKVEQGSLRLNGPLGGGKHPLLHIRVPAGQDERGITRYSSWGWWVGTSSLESPGFPSPADLGVDKP